MPSRAVLSALRSHLEARPSRTGSLIISLYGDAIVPRGGALWLGSLMELCRALGIGDGVVRTAASRLAREGWLERTRRGRNSYYRLAEKGRATFAAATRRIYHGVPPAWDGRFTLGLLAPAAGPARRTRDDDASIGHLAPGLLVGLAPGDAAWPEDAIRLDAQPASMAEARRLAARAWPLDDIAARYAHFLALVTPDEAAPDDPPLSDLEALLLRVLLIHEFRRVILRDPLLPPALLPPDWPGHRARQRCGDLYRALVPASERWLDRHGQGEDGPLPGPDDAFARRFAAA